ncbi:hypothetical protein FB451DRAFT_1291893 [Mycena latifolia]|nr:hypothetical protein FB451DRAFT_1291893 [Mycena latifolia]
MDTHPTFPTDLEREIFETTALMHPSTIPTLLRVARRILIWIEPLLYRVARISGEKPHSRMADALLRATKTKPPSFFHGVRHLLLEPPAHWDMGETKDILQLCTGLVDFSAIGDITLDPTILPILAELPLQRFSGPLNTLFGGVNLIDSTHPFFASITHLDAFDDLSQICTEIPLLPALTHFGLDQEVSWDMVETILADCPRLEVLIVSFPGFKDEYACRWSENTPIKDVRFVVGLYTDYAAEWEAGANGLGNFWSLADDFVARKRRGEIDAGCYWLYT